MPTVAQPTLQQIAQRTGVSPRTVANILQGRNKGVYKRTLQRAQHVRQVAREMGYRPNAAARAIATGRFGAYAMLYRPDQGSIDPRLLAGMHDAMTARNLHLSVAELPLRGDEDPKVLREMCVDGLLVNYMLPIQPTLIDRVRAHGIPAVWINTRHAVDCVYPDDHDAARRATEALLAAGHRRVRYLDVRDQRRPMETDHYSVVDRLAGYREAMAAAGLTPDEALLHVPFDTETQRPHTGRLAVIGQMLATMPAATAYVAYGETVANTLLYAAAGHGLAVPCDLSLVTFSSGVVSTTGVPVSTFKIPLASLGRVAVERLTLRIDEPDRPLPATAVPYGPMKGDTIAPLRSPASHHHAS